MHKITTYLLCLAIMAAIAPVSFAEETFGGYMGTQPKTLYATFYEYGLQVFDVSDPANPVNIGEYLTPRQQAVDAEIVGDYAYVADGFGGMEIYNIANPAKIELVKSFKRPADARAIDVEGNYAYIAAADSMQIYDISDPANAFWITTYDEDITFDQSLDVMDGMAYVGCGVDGLKIYDVDPPLDTHKIGQVIPPGMARDVVIEGQYAYVASGAAGLQIIDISFPDDPQITGNGLHIGNLTDGIFIDGNLCYCADRYTGLHIVDISDPFNPFQLGNIRLKGKASDVVVMGDYAFVAAVSGDISIVDITDSANPTLVKWLRWHGTARSVVVTG